MSIFEEYRAFKQKKKKNKVFEILGQLPYLFGFENRFLLKPVPGTFVPYCHTQTKISSFLVLCVICFQMQFVSKCFCFDESTEVLFRVD